MPAGEGEVIVLPRYPEIVRLNVGDVLDVGVTRGGESARVTIPLTGETAPVPQWFKRPGEPEEDEWLQGPTVTLS